MNDPTIQTEKLEQDLDEHEYYADPHVFIYTFILIALLFFAYFIFAVPWSKNIETKFFINSMCFLSINLLMLYLAHYYNKTHGFTLNKGNFVYIACNGSNRVFDRWHSYALAIIFCILIFELFFITAWLHDYTLVWQPEWVKKIIIWMKAHAYIPSQQKPDWPITAIIISSDSPFKKVFPNEMAFLNSYIGNSGLLFSFFRLFTVPLIIVCCYKVFGGFVDALGMKEINPKYIKSFTQFLGCLVFTPPLILFLLVGVAMFTIAPLDKNILAMLSVKTWLQGFALYMTIILFVICGLKAMFGWCSFIASLFTKILRVIKWVVT